MRFAQVHSILLVLLLAARSVIAGPDGRTGFRTARLSNNDGLSNSSVTTVFQDSCGLMWFGTWDGLNRYDGTAFRSYRPAAGDTSAISNNIIRQIMEERKGILWIVTDYGINRYDRQKDNFRAYYLGYNNKGTFRENSFLCTRSPKNRIVASAYNSGLFLFDPHSREFTELSVEGLNTGTLTCLFFDKYDRLWAINEKKELYVLDLPSGADACKTEIQADRISLPVVPARIRYDGEERIWTQQEDGTLGFCTVTTGHWEKCSDKNLKIPELNTVIKNESGYLFATSSGIVRYDEIARSAIRIFPGTAVLSLYRGSQGILWAGTDSQGILKILPSERYFHSYTRDNIPGLGHHAVRAIYKDILNNLWVGTKGGGLFRIRHLGAANLQETSRFTTEEGLLNNSVLALASATGRNFWIGTDGQGLNYYSFSDRKIKKLRRSDAFDPEEISSVYALLQTGPETLWVGTSGKGLFRLTLSGTPESGYTVTARTAYRFDPRLPGGINNNIVYSLQAEGDSVLWIATRGGGLNRLDTRTGRIRAFRNNPADMSSISNDDVICLYTDSNRRLWAGTSNGLNRIYRNTEGEIAFKRYTEGDGLPNNTVHGILEDATGQIWISTNKGISRIDFKSDQVVNYYYNDGLQDNEFSDGAYLAAGNRRDLYFGGINGFTTFHPEHIGISDYTPPLLLQSFKIDNRPQPLPDCSGRLLEIGSSENFLSFHFAVLDYIATQKCEIAYTLHRSGTASDNWIHIGNGREIILSNLSPGNYRLDVRYTNSDNRWNKEIFSVPFRVRPPWWKSAWAYTGYTILFLLGAFLIFRFQKYRLNMLHKLELEKMETAQKEEIHQAKLRFFTNIAHEFSNSITLIYGPCERLLSDEDMPDKNRKYLNIIRRSAGRMQNLIQQLMEFRKAETGHLTLRYEPVDVPEMIKYTSDHFLDIRDQKKITLRFENHNFPQPWYIDRDALEKIIFNLISNAFKYTPAEGIITLELRLTPDGSLCFRCRNTGKGIRREEISSAFNRFEVLDNFENQLSQGVYTRNGIGLAMCRNLAELMKGTITADSIPGEYTVFTVVIPPSQERPETASRPVVPPVRESLPAASGRKTVLIVDDQQEIRELIADTLNQKYRTEEADNGKTAWEKIQDLHPDLIICDIIMPGMDGIALLRLIKEEKETRHIPVVLLSSRNTIESQIEGLETGADMYLSKPFHPHHLLAAVDRMLGNQEIIRHYLESARAYAENYNGKLIDKQDKDFMERMMAQLLAHRDNEDYNQDALADDLAVSRVQLYRKIKKLTGTTPADFIRTFRLQEAEKMLRTTTKTVQEIMQECGFRNKAYFYREFARIYQCTPKEYHNRMHQL